jgi:hypothetical protein
MIRYIPPRYLASSKGRKEKFYDAKYLLAREENNRFLF